MNILHGPGRLFAAVYGAVSYVIFVAVFVYAILFVGNVAVPRTVDRAIEATPVAAVAIDLALLFLFAAQHSVMARPGFKRWWTRYIPQPIERSTYVLTASSVLALLCWQWRGLPAIVWDVTWTPARFGLWTTFWLGWAIVLASTFMISHFELFGLSQVFALWRRKPQAQSGFQSTLFYRLVRHPLNLGFLIAFWSAPTMSVGRLLFAATTTVWILLAMRLEERDLVAALGAPYAAYRRTVPMLLPRIRRQPSTRHASEAPSSRSTALT